MIHIYSGPHIGMYNKRVTKSKGHKVKVLMFQYTAVIHHFL